jgi:gamma-glutamyl phosphate reductase
MSKSRQTRETAKAFVTPLFAWNAAVLKGGQMMIDSIAAAAKNVRVAVLDADTPRKAGKAKSAARRAKRRRR